MKNTSIVNMTKPSATATRQPQSNQSTKKNSEDTSTFEELYLAKDYKGAAQFLLNNKQQFDSGIFHFNLGTVYSKMGDYPVARFHLEKAIQEGYVNSASLNNLNFIRSQNNNEDLTTSSSLPDKIVDNLSSLPSQGYVSLTLALILISLLLIKSKVVKQKISIVLILLLSLSPLVLSHFYVNKLNKAITLKEVVIYEGPSKIFNEKGKLKPGSKIILGDFKDGWFYIKFPISFAGWISKDQLGLY